MRYAKINKMDIVNGEGIAVSLFVQGCNHHCKGCFNPETWNFNDGYEWTEDIENHFLELCKLPYIDCVSILGGEPFDQDEPIFCLLEKIKDEVNKPIYLWSGYTFEKLMTRSLWCARECLRKGFIDFLIDGEFEEDKKNLNLKLRGSSNQRVVDVKKSIAQNDVVIKN